MHSQFEGKTLIWSRRRKLSDCALALVAAAGSCHFTESPLEGNKTLGNLQIRLNDSLLITLCMSLCLHVFC